MTGPDRPAGTGAQAFLRDFATLSAFGATPGGGVDRQAATPEDHRTRAWLTDWLRTNGCTVRTDPIGNIFGLVELVPDAPYVVVGSHLDSQPLAGRFDGAYGVLAAAHAVRAVRDELRRDGTRPAFNLAVVDWFNEEGCRFKPSMMGSAVFTGQLDLRTALATTDRDGVTVRAALDAGDGRDTFPGPPVAAYAEIHVEQGHLLEESGYPIGLVATAWCANKFEVRVTGEQAHTGPTRMRDRRDALLGAARLVVAVNELLDGFAEETLHTAVSELTVLPNSPVVVAREVTLLIDIRAPEASIVAAAVDRLRTAITRIEEDCRVSVETLAVSTWDSGPFPESGLELAAAAADSRGHRSIRAVTIAGHDATNMAGTVPTVLLFVPSVGGISHNERELTLDTDLIAGLEVLTEVVRRLALGELEETRTP